MENATKALLIAAAVLIAIVIIAISVLLLGNASNISEDAEKVGDSISMATEEAVIEIQGGVYLSEKELEDLLNGIGYSAHIGLNYKYPVFVTGYLLKGYSVERDGEYIWYDEQGKIVEHVDGKKIVDTWIPEKLKSGQLKLFKNPGNASKVKKEFVKYKDSVSGVTEKLPNARFCFLDKDNNLSQKTGNPITRVVYYLTVAKVE